MSVRAFVVCVNTDVTSVGPVGGIIFANRTQHTQVPNRSRVVVAVRCVVGVDLERVLAQTGAAAIDKGTDQLGGVVRTGRAVNRRVDLDRGSVFVDRDRNRVRVAVRVFVSDRDRTALNTNDGVFVVPGTCCVIRSQSPVIFGFRFVTIIRGRVIFGRTVTVSVGQANVPFVDTRESIGRLLFQVKVLRRGITVGTYPQD